MNLHVFASSQSANAAAAACLAEWLGHPATRNLMVAGGNTPLELYARVAQRGLDLRRLHVFVLDEYVGVPLDEPRTCSNLLRARVAEAWKIPADQFFPLTSVEARALAAVREHEEHVVGAGGLDAIVLGLGQNGHLGFNEPGSSAESEARVLNLEAVSIAANRDWFGGKYAPDKGATVGLRTILSARKVLVLAYGPAKRVAVRNMVEGPISDGCPASFLQRNPGTSLFLDESAAALLRPRA